MPQDRRSGAARLAPRRRMWSAPVLAKYWTLQVPGAALVALLLYLLRDTLGLQTWMLWSIVALWMVKDALLYPIVWRSYDPSPADAWHALEGARCVAVDRLAPAGYVRMQGELWHAELVDRMSAVDRGAPVRVHAVRGLTLLVEPDERRQSPPESSPGER